MTDGAATALERVRIGLVSISDRASAGVYEDKGLPALREWLARAVRNPIDFEERLIPDDAPTIGATLRELVDVAHCALVLTTGGTGPAPRDVTPEATLAVADRDPVAPGRRDPGAEPDPEPAGAAEGDRRDAAGPARARAAGAGDLRRRAVLRRPDRRPVHRNRFVRLQGISAKNRTASAPGLSGASAAQAARPLLDNEPSAIF